MEEFKADILSKNKKGQWSFYLSLSFILLVFIVLILLQIIPIFLQIFSIIIWVFAVAKYILQTKKQVFKKTVGILTINNEAIAFYDDTHRLTEIISIKISISGWKSYRRSHDRHFPVSDMNHGDKNFLTVITKDATLKCEFSLESLKHWQLLRAHVLSWYDLDMKINEDANGGRTYGLEVLTYKEIQEFKKVIQASKIRHR